MGTTAAYISSVSLFAVILLYNGAANGSDDGQHERNTEPAFATPAMLLTFVTLGKFLEAYAKGKTATALKTLMELQPLFATRVTFTHNNEDDEKDDEYWSGVDIAALQTQEIAASDIKMHDILYVLPGARIPTDGVIVAMSGTNNNNNIEECTKSGG